MSVHPLLRAIVEAAGVGEGNPKSSAPRRGSAADTSTSAEENDRSNTVGRSAGSLAEHKAQRVCIDRLEALGFRVVERPFEFSAWPGHFATPIGGLLLFFGALLIWLGTRAGSVDLPLAIGSALFTVAVVGGAAAVEYGPTSFKRDRRKAVNIEATRGTPNIWLVAHLDSKSQTIPILLRIAAIVMSGVAWTIILTLWMTTFLIRIPGAIFAPFAVVAMIAALPLTFTFVGNTNTGALDNASGVTTILEAVTRLAPATPIGVLITSAEELGLAGARAWVVGKTPGIAINVDSIDDRGGWRCMLSHDDGHATLRTAIADATRAWRIPHHEVRRTEGQRREGRRHITIRSVLPGVLVDAVAFKDAGWPAMTLSRGGLGSLARIHTSRDTLAHLSGDGIDASADLVVRIVGAIIARSTE